MIKINNFIYQSLSKFSVFLNCLIFNDMVFTILSFV